MSWPTGDICPQLLPDGLEERLWDVGVVGAGPAGCVAALHLAARGHAVVLLDAARIPREKVCGDALLPDAARGLERAGVLDQVVQVAHRVDRLDVHSTSGAVFTVPGRYLTLERRRLDALLASAASARGARVLLARVSAVVRDAPGRWRLRLAASSRELVTRTVVLATGADVSLARGLGLVDQVRPTAVALRRYVLPEAPLEALAGSFAGSILPAYAWAFPMAGAVVNVGCGAVLAPDGSVPVDLHRVYHDFVSSPPPGLEVLRSARNLGPLRGAVLRCGLSGGRAVLPEGLLVVGETLGATLPLSGEGVGKAMETAELAAEVLDEALAGGDLRVLVEYAERLERRLGPTYRAYRAAQRFQAHPFLAEALARRAAQSRRLQELLAGVIRGEVEPDRVFSVGGLLRSFLR